MTMTISLTSQTITGEVVWVRSSATTRKRSALPSSATAPPIAIMLAEAKNAVSRLRLVMICESKIRGSRVTKTAIQRRRYSDINSDVDGRDRGGCSTIQLENSHEKIKSANAPRSQVEKGRRSSAKTMSERLDDDDPQDRNGAYHAGFVENAQPCVAFGEDAFLRAPHQPAGPDIMGSQQRHERQLDQCPDRKTPRPCQPQAGNHRDHRKSGGKPVEAKGQIPERAVFSASVEVTLPVDQRAGHRKDGRHPTHDAQNMNDLDPGHEFPLFRAGR